MSKGKRSPPLDEGNRVFRTVGRYELTSLGAPFRVTLINSVEVGEDHSGQRLVRIPDVFGLIRVVLRVRLTDARKLSGADLRFVRRALNVRIEKLAALLGCSVEHFVKCEAGGGVLPVAAERQLRLLAYVASLCNAPHELGSPPVFRDQRSEQLALKAMNVFMTMNIETFRDVNDNVEYTFTRGRVEEVDFDGDDVEVHETASVEEDWKEAA